ncbi:MAG: hypothetical protein GEV06_16795 [Luteitalea sp.]|nr:hypothetical protein [Luteitalea sp.]
MDPGVKDSPQAENTSYDGVGPEVEPARAALVKEWFERIECARKHWDHVFKRMDKCEQWAAEGADKKWVDADKYTVPIIPRHINQIVAALYAKDPRVLAKRRKQLMYQVWDGDPQSLQMLQQAMAMQAEAAEAGVMTPLPPEMDALSQEIVAVDQYNKMVDKIGKTLEILWGHYTGEQDCDFKAELKALVRRTKVCSVGFCELGYQRILEPRPDVDAQISDVTAKIKATEAAMGQMAEGKLEEDSPTIEELRLNLQDLQQQESLVVREGPVFDWPNPRNIIIDENLKNLKTLRGANWYSRWFDMTPRQVAETYNGADGKPLDLKDAYTKYKSAEKRNGDKKMTMCRVHKVHDKRNRQCFVLIEGYPDFVVEPQASDVKLERFFPLFPLVFNEVEHENQKYPQSDVWLMRHAQFDMNRAREARREHRHANRPKYFAGKGSLEDADLKGMESAPAHAVIEVNLSPNEDINKKVQKFDHVGIDPNQYEVETAYQDALRAVGTQEANLGSLSGGTATESSIAEQSRMSSIADNIDDLDEFLSALAKATGQLMLLEVTKDTAIEIAGPGAVWPDAPPTREEIAKDLLLEIKAGSSGRPNQAADLANMERALPYLIQLPGVNPQPLAEKYAELLGIDMEELYVAGAPSITAMNAMASKPISPFGAGEGAESDPGQQGPEGANNAQGPQENENEAGGQPAFPGPMTGQAPGVM